MPPVHQELEAAVKVALKETREYRARQEWSIQRDRKQLETLTDLHTRLAACLLQPTQYLVSEVNRAIAVLTWVQAAHAMAERRRAVEQAQVT